MKHSRMDLRRGRALAAAAATAIVLSGCAGGAGGGSSAGAGGGSGDGYEHGATPEEIQEVFEDVDPVTITYQPSAQSSEGIDAYRAEAFIENLETLSGGKITVETTYGQGIAGYTELPDALVDGRVDIAYMLPIYQPDEFPVFQAWVTGTTLTGASPLVDEIAANAAIGELTYDDENLMSEFRDRGIEPLNMFNSAGAVFALCGEEHVSPDDWDGNQVRASSQAQTAQLNALSASPVSLQYTETFEALQRGTVDCTLSTTLAADAAGFLEVAPHIAYTSEVTFARGPGGVYAGSAWESWPLAVQQLVFDSMQDEFVQARRGDLDANHIAAEMVREEGGSFTEMDDGLQDDLQSASEGLVEEEVSEGLLPEGSADAIPESVDKWRGIAAELGYEDEGSFEDFDEWYSMEDEDYLEPMGEKFFNEVMLPHRPS
ncbi:C4-dicarboxylate ABC transporter substrate-binding protein [Brevibacterium jeotgali]|uniref:TRAP-type C4-dicarboxylate transport system, substrate-binding protein n=1 Tax=Brevibacterium jeotgali TaxID=1262550 RepID=A0A2H1L6Y4_9MICO|nr:C4-dicarboxylate ABC transporter substrate-binding protein [Brevibacterium jeotgali]TWC02290.1 TRAP-type C4-dicarboxylate transport system substrate-binding protein [Brevibacterium jeotgali]SMY12658.1 TRAP-type C4-dicarboxylate transport system, substrate-binding protein [Brevibacterium jeotgali]